MIKILSKLSIIFLLLLSSIWILNAGNQEGGFLWEARISEDLYDKNNEKSLADNIEVFLIYLIWFLYLLAVVYWMYWWFIILTASSDDEKVKKWKTIVIQAVLWLIVIYLSSTIIRLVLDIYTKTS